MLALYLIALAVGGTLVAVSIVFGGHDADLSGGGHLELAGHDGVALDHAGAADHGGEVPVGDALAAWLPLSSLRFWTFFLAFFGLTGTLLAAFGGAGRIAAAAIAAAVGYASGVGVTAVVRRLRSHEVDSSVGSGDAIGETATVLLPVARGKPGKVRLQLKGRAVDFIAVTDDDGELAAHERVVVYSVGDEGSAQVTRDADLVTASDRHDE